MCYYCYPLSMQKPYQPTKADKATLAAIRYQLDIARAVRRHKLADVANAVSVSRTYLSAVLHGTYRAPALLARVLEYVEKAHAP